MSGVRMISPSNTWLPTAPQDTRKVAIGSQLPGSWCRATVSVPAAWVTGVTRQVRTRLVVAKKVFSFMEFS